MVWYAWAMIALYVVGFAATVYMIDKPRKPVTHGQAVVHGFVCAPVIYAIVTLAAT